MAIPAWPPGLPDLIGLVGSLGTSQLYEPPKTTPMDDGPGRTRTRTLISETPRSIVLMLNRDEFEIFARFVRGTLNKGARRFTAPVRLSSGRRGIRTCRIDGTVAEQDLGPHSRVSFTLRIYDW
jgi:hypothetical protein